MAPQLRSIQGEQQADYGTEEISEADLDTYVRDASDDTLECRERGHDFPSVRRSDSTFMFDGVDGDGNFTRHLACTRRCGAQRVELWSATRRGKHTRFERVGSNMRYTVGDNGKPYLAPAGRGRIYRRHLRDAVMTMAMEGVSLTQVKKNARMRDK